MLKVKMLVKLLAIWVVVLAVFMLFSLYQDIRENKLMNYTDVYASSEVDVQSEYKANTTLKYVFTITSHDDYLGSISFNYFRLKDNPGQVIFRIKEASQSNWYAENRYDFSFFNNDDDYHFGFPEIATSKNQEFIIEFEIVSPNLSQEFNVLDLKTLPILTAKYVFPRDTVYKSPDVVATILVKRSADTIGKADQVKVVILTFALAALTFLALYRGGNQARSTLEIKPKDLQKNVQLLSNWTNRLNPFFVPAGILAILVLAFISGNLPLAERMAVYLWLTLLASCVFYTLQVTLLHKLKRFTQLLHTISINIISLIDDLMTKRTILVGGILYVIISGLSATYYLGGDDSRLFYLYPREFLTNYASKIVSDTGVSQLTNTIPPGSLSAFIVLMAGLRTVLPIFNLQTLLNSANLLGGFFAFYYLVRYLLGSQGKHERVIGILTAFMYVFSIFNFYTLFNSRLMAEYLISLFPLSLLLGIKAVREGKFYLFVAVALIWSAFNFISVTFPLSAAALITCLPLLVFTTWKHKVRLVTYLIGAGLLFGTLNLHWFAFIPYTKTSSIASSEFRQLNEAGIRTVTEINNSFFPLLNSYHQKIQYNFHWPQLPIYSSWYLKTLLTGYVLIAVVVLAGLAIEKDRLRVRLYIWAVVGFALAIYFFTVNVGPFGVTVFLWLSNHLPGFVIFRNMYDKFAYSMALHWAIILAVSLSVLIKFLKSDNHKSYLLFLIFLIAVINAKPFVLGEFERLPYWTTHNSYDGIRGFNKDYLELLDFVKNQNTTGRYLSLPLLTGNSVIVEDQYQKNHYYAGVSPLLLLTGKNDLSGLISFSDKSNDVYHWIKKREYENFGKLLQQLNTQYVIVNNSVPEDLQSSFMFSDGLFALQSKQFISSVLGEKIKDFGERYSLYEISPRYSSSKIYIADDPGAFTNQGSNLTFTKIASHEYKVQISQLSRTQTLVFLDPYLKGWQLRTPGGKVMFDNSHTRVLGYANAWKLDPLDVKLELAPNDYRVDEMGRVGLDLRLYFQPYDYYLPTQLISVCAYILATFFVMGSFLRLKKR